MTQLFAQPYDISATGFYFETAEQYEERAEKAVSHSGDPVEEFEIEFIDGERIDAELAKAFSLSQCNFAQFLEAAEAWQDDQKLTFIIAVGECGYSFDLQLRCQFT